MKKQYIIPSIKVRCFQTARILAGSEEDPQENDRVGLYDEEEYKVTDREGFD